MTLLVSFSYFVLGGKHLPEGLQVCSGGARVYPNSRTNESGNVCLKHGFYHTTRLVHNGEPEPNHNNNTNNQV